jgi:CTP synthase (UTP-ammonia lyase)
LLNKYVKGKVEETKVKMIANEASEIELKQWQALSKEYDNVIKEQTKQVVDKEKELTDARKAHADALEDVAEK